MGTITSPIQHKCFGCLTLQVVSRHIVFLLNALGTYRTSLSQIVTNPHPSRT